MPTLLLPHVPRGERAGPSEPRTASIVLPRWLLLAARARRVWRWALAHWRHLVELGLAVLATTFVLGRFPLPGILDFGYRSCARGVALLFLGGVVAGAPGLALARSRIGAALLALTLVASASVVLAGGRTAAVGALWTALGLFHAVRAIATDERGRRRLVHGLGLVCSAVLAHELWHQPALLWLREEQRHALVTEHPNTLGFALALLLPVLLAATAQRRMRAAACLHAAAACAVLLATFSRAAWLALAGSLVALALATRPTRRGGGTSGVAGRAAARVRVEASALAAVVLTAAVAALSRGRTGGDAQRLRILETSWSLFREHWPLGIGFGSGNLEPLFPVRYLEHHGESLFLFHSHDLYVDLLTGCGVAGALAALVLFAAVGCVARRALSFARGRAARAEAAGHAISFAVFLGLGLVDTPLYHGRLLFLSVVLWAMLDAAAACAVRSHEPKKAASALPSAPRMPHAAVRRARHRVC